MVMSMEALPYKENPSKPGLFIQEKELTKELEHDRRSQKYLEVNAERCTIHFLYYSEGTKFSCRSPVQYRKGAPYACRG